MIILIDTEMAFDEIQHHLYKNSLESGHAWNIPQHNKGHITANLQLISYSMVKS